MVLTIIVTDVTINHFHLLGTIQTKSSAGLKSSRFPYNRSSQAVRAAGGWEKTRPPLVPDNLKKS